MRRRERAEKSLNALHFAHIWFDYNLCGFRTEQIIQIIVLRGLCSRHPFNKSIFSRFFYVNWVKFSHTHNFCFSSPREPRIENILIDFFLLCSALFYHHFDYHSQAFHFIYYLDQVAGFGFPTSSVISIWWLIKNPNEIGFFPGKSSKLELWKFLQTTTSKLLLYIFPHRIQNKFQTNRFVFVECH